MGVGWFNIPTGHDRSFSGEVVRPPLPFEKSTTDEASKIIWWCVVSIDNSIILSNCSTKLKKWTEILHIKFFLAMPFTNQLIPFLKVKYKAIRYNRSLKARKTTIYYHIVSWKAINFHLGDSRTISIIAIRLTLARFPVKIFTDGTTNIRSHNILKTKKFLKCQSVINYSVHI